jgi:glycolate oxidase
MTGDPAEKIQELKSKYGDRIITDTDRFSDYARDASEIKVIPPAIFFAETETEVREIIDLCRKIQLPVVFRGAGTGYTGGAVPVPDGLVLSLERLKKLEIQPDRKIAFCGPGVITIDLMTGAGKFGLSYPPDPASYDESTLGGNIAECAGGLHCKKYGVTKDYVIGLKAITARGEIMKTGIYSDCDLFDLGGLLVGSEGILAAVTEIAVRLIEEEATAEITEKGIIPAVMEYMDGDAIECSLNYEKSVEIEEAEAVLLFETSGCNAGPDADKIIDICRRQNADQVKVEEDREKAERLWKIRRNLSKAVKASARHKIAEDVCVPPSRLPELVEFVAELNRELPLRVNSYGHAGDGNLHVNFLTDDDYHLEGGLIEKSVRRLFEKTLELGGTLTGEHGIGLTKKKYLPLEFSDDTLSAMKIIKSIFDPERLFNPGKMFD